MTPIRASITRHAIGASIGIVLLPVARTVLHRAADGPLPTAGGYVFAWTAFAAAWVLQKRYPDGAWFFIAWALFLTAVTDVPVVHATVTELTGVTW